MNLFFILLLSLPVTVCASGISSNHAKNKQLPTVVKTENFITQFGITWYFDKAYTTGQFANGDHYVVGPVKIVGINPPSALRNGRTLNGSMINPSPLNGSAQGYDSATYGKYGPSFNATMNVARPNNQNLSVSNPLILPVNSSLVSSISIVKAGNTPQLKTAAILTILDKAPVDGSFRPAYSNPDKTIKFNKSEINYSLLSSLAPPASNTPPLITVEKYFERPWLDHVPSWIGWYIHPVDNMNHYGREIATTVGTAALMLNLNFANTLKQTLTIRFIQFGIDSYGIIEAGGTKNWEPDGGHASGRKLPILMAGHLLNDKDMKNIGKRSDILFGEDAQTFYVTQTEIDKTNSTAWDPDLRTGFAEPYSSADLGTAEWGIRHATYPQHDNSHWKANYRQCCTANAWSGIVLAVHVMGLKTSWNHNALFDYQDRYMTNQLGEDKWKRAWSKFQGKMWDIYRNRYK